MNQVTQERCGERGEPPGKVGVVAVAGGVVPGVVTGVGRGVLAGFAEGRLDACQRLRFRRAATADIFSGFKGARAVPCRGGFLALGRWGIGRALSRRSRVRLVVTAAVPRDDDGAKRR
jgi:hypothetical protein